MELSKITQAAGDLLELLKHSKLKPDEKIAALKSAASIIENVLSAEMLKHMWARVLDNQPK
jgi:hypothetical protein